MSAYVVLARRWRPRTFEALVGQGHVTQALTHALTTGRVPHALLFSGIRGVGKTTLARLLAMCLECAQGVSAKPCGQCGPCSDIIAGSHPDVFEIDAASRTKVEQMREVLDMVGYSPVVSRYKVYILDEVHMLSTQSFNALLKTLEEPPAHVKFIFATTEVRKIPATILSRCQRYDLKRVSSEVLTAHLAAILEQEKTAFDVQGLAAVVRAAEGSVRDALSLLDQAIAHGAGTIRLAAVQELLGLTDQESVWQLFGQLLHGQGQDVWRGAALFYSNGVEPESLVRELLDATHQATRRKVLGTVIGDRLDTVTADVSLEHLQMVYQVLLRGSQDMQLAADVLQALEMLLLRAAYLKPVPSLEKLLAGMGGGGSPSLAHSDAVKPVAVPSGGGGVAHSSGFQASTMASTTASTITATVAVSQPGMACPSRSQVHTTAAVAVSAQEVARAVGQTDSGRGGRERLTSWEQLVSSASAEDASLGVRLQTQVSCLEFYIAPEGEEDGQAATKEPSRIVLQLVDDFLGSRSDYQQLVTAWLATQGITGVVVIVEGLGTASRPQTIAEADAQRSAEQQEWLVKQVGSHPAVQRLATRLQAECIRVRPMVAAEAEQRRAWQ